MNKALWDLPTPASLRYFWNFGSILGVCLIIQISSGLFLRFYYSSFHSERFLSVLIIIKEVWNGWAIRLIHINGASIFFLFIYLHIFRGLFYIRSNNKKTWFSGIIIFFLLIAISFMGYVLPWGQISYWAVAVITNLFSILPVVGDMFVQWIWGGFSVRKPTLIRFYSLHFLMPIALVFMVVLHLIFLHQKGSRNQMNTPSNIDKIRFHPYFTTKDTIFILGSLSVLIIASMLTPYLTLDPENNIPANPIQTPLHIQPEWYFLPFYTILRAMPRKSIGVVALLASILVLAVLSLFRTVFSVKFRFYRFIFYWTFVARFIILIGLGALPAEEPYIQIGAMWTLIYFSSIILMNS